jgi:hypothetical protein
MRNEEELRSALLERDFTLAQSLVRAWGDAVSAEMKAASGEAERRRILEEARSFGEQNLYLAQVVRAHIATELNANSASFLYADADLELPRWRLSA